MARAADLIPVTEARHNLRALIDKLGDGEVVLLRHSRPAAILLSPERYESLLDQIEELEDQCSVLRSRLHPEDRIPLDKVKEQLGL